MDVTIVVLLALLLAGVLAVVAVTVYPLLFTLRAQSVIVNLRTDKAFRGVLVRDRGRLLVLANASLHEHGRWAPVDGRVVIEKRLVDFIQITPSAPVGEA